MSILPRVQNLSDVTDVGTGVQTGPVAGGLLFGRPSCGDLDRVIDLLMIPEIGS